MKIYLRILWPTIRVFALVTLFSFPFQHTASAQEMCLFDQTYTSTADEHGFHYFTVDSGLSDNWLEPFNYYEGTFHFRYEILDYLGMEPFMLSVCIWSDVKHTPKGSWKTWSETCSPQLLIPDHGVYTTQTIPATWWQINKEKPVNFARVNDFLKLGIVYWCDNRKNLSDWVPEDKGCWSKAESLLPIKTRVTIVAVAKGYEFSGWE